MKYRFGIPSEDSDVLNSVWSRALREKYPQLLKLKVEIEVESSIEAVSYGNILGASDEVHKLIKKIFLDKLTREKIVGHTRCTHHAETT